MGGHEVNFKFKDTSTVGRPGDMQPRLLWCIIIYRNFSIEIVIVCLLYRHVTLVSNKQLLCFAIHTSFAMFCMYNNMLCCRPSKAFMMP